MFTHEPAHAVQLLGANFAHCHSVQPLSHSFNPSTKPPFILIKPSLAVVLNLKYIYDQNAIKFKGC